MCAFPTAVSFVSSVSGKKGERAVLHHLVLPLGQREIWARCRLLRLLHLTQRPAMQWRTRPPAGKDIPPGKSARMEHVHWGGFQGKR